MAASHRLLVPIAGSLTLIAGFAVAQATGNRSLGGAIVALGGAACVAAWWRKPGPGRALSAVAVFAVAFAVAHPLGRAIGAWPAVLLASTAAGLAAWLLAAEPAEVEVEVAPKQAYSR